MNWQYILWKLQTYQFFHASAYPMDDDGANVFRVVHLSMHTYIPGGGILQLVYCWLSSLLLFSVANNLLWLVYVIN